MIRQQASRSLRTRIALGLLATLGLTAVLLSPAGAGAARKAPKPPKAGKYAGKVGTFARIIFKVRGRRMVAFNAGVKTNCQRSSDGVITETKNLATAPAEQEPVAKLTIAKGRSRAFGGLGKDESGVEWKVKGRFVSRTKAKGSFEASKFESIFNPFLPFGIDGQLCAGSGNWVAKLKR